MRTRARLLNENRRDGAASHAATHLRVLRSGWSPRLLFVTAPRGAGEWIPAGAQKRLDFQQSPNRP